MTRSTSFSISAAGHVVCVGLMLLTVKSAKEKPVVVEVGRVSLFSHPVAAPSPAPKRSTPTPPARPRPPKPAPREPKPERSRETPKILTRDRQIVVPNPPEPKFDLPPIDRVEPRPLRPVPTNKDRRSDLANAAMSPNQASLLDAYIASFIKSNWNRPSEASVGDDPPPVSVAIRITKDGRITLRGVTCSSGVPELDRSAVRAIERSGRLPRHLLSYISGRHYDVTIVFRITDTV